MQKIRKAVIPAAGFGTRFLPETKAMPKEMLPIVDKPTIQYIVEEIKASGIEQILIISGHAKRAIEDHFDSSPELEEHLYESGKMDLLKEVRKVASVKIHYTRQPYMRGLGDAILCAKDFIDDEPFGVILGDDVVYNGNETPALKQLMDQYQKTGATIIGCQIVPQKRSLLLWHRERRPNRRSESGSREGYDRETVYRGSTEPVRSARPLCHHTGYFRNSGTDEAREGRRDPAHRRPPRHGT